MEETPPADDPQPDILVEIEDDTTRTYHTRILLAAGLTDPIFKNSDLDDEDEFPEFKDRNDGRELTHRIVNLRGVEYVIVLNYNIKVVRAKLFDWDTDKIDGDTLEALKTVLRFDTGSADPLVLYVDSEPDPPEPHNEPKAGSTDEA